MISNRIFAPALAAIVITIASALSAFGHDGLHEQIEAITKEIKRSPNDAALYLKRAELYRLHREFGRAWSDLNRASKLNPKLTIIDLRRGKIRYDQRRFVQSRFHLERFNRTEPESFEGLVALARTTAKLGETDRATQLFSRAIKLSKADAAELYIERAAILADVGRYADAVTGLDEGIAELGPLVTLTMAAIDLELKMGRIDQALERIDRLALTMERKESFFLKKGEILIRARRLCEARAALLEARKGYDSRTPAQRNVRAVRAEIARLEAAINKTASCRD